MISVFPHPALFYIDPGSGALTIQLFASGIIGVTFWFRKRIASLIGRLKTSFRKTTDQ